jgi:hypothetical protein
VLQGLGKNLHALMFHLKEKILNEMPKISLGIFKYKSGEIPSDPEAIREDEESMVHKTALEKDSVVPVVGTEHPCPRACEGHTFDSWERDGNKSRLGHCSTRTVRGLEFSHGRRIVLIGFPATVEGRKKGLMRGWS